MAPLRHAIAAAQDKLPFDPIDGDWCIVLPADAHGSPRLAAPNRSTDPAISPLAMTDAAPPRRRASHAKAPAGSPRRRRTNMDMEAATIRPSTEIGRSQARHPFPASAASRRW
jgi:hypothetical protein